MLNQVQDQVWMLDVQLTQVCCSQIISLCWDPAPASAETLDQAQLGPWTSLCWDPGPGSAETLDQALLRPLRGEGLPEVQEVQELHEC